MKTRLFRGADPVVGDRVTVLWGNREKIGVVTRQTADTIFLDDAPLPRREIDALRVMPPQRVRNSEIRALEVATAKAFPGVEHRWSEDRQWLLRAGDGITERSNSAAPLGPSVAFCPIPLGEIEEFYRRHQLPVRVLVPERLHKPLEHMVTGPGWSLGQEIIVMSAPLAAQGRSEKQSTETAVAGVPEAVSFDIEDQPDDAWLQLYHFRGQALPPQALELLRTDIDGRMAFARLRDSTGATIAITRATITNGYLGYSAVEVAEGRRRQGLGTYLGRKVMEWGRSQGAHTAYLQVISSNTAGLGLYRRLGFQEHHRHRYAQKVI